MVFLLLVVSWFPHVLWTSYEWCQNLKLVLEKTSCPDWILKNDLQITSIILLTKPRDMYPKLQLVERCYIHKVNRFHYYHNNDWNKILWL